MDCIPIWNGYAQLVGAHKTDATWLSTIIRMPRRATANADNRASHHLSPRNGERLGERTKNNTKCMVRVNGIALNERLLMREKAVD